MQVAMAQARPPVPATAIRILDMSEVRRDAFGRLTTSRPSGAGAIVFMTFRLHITFTHAESAAPTRGRRVAVGNVARHLLDRAFCLVVDVVRLERYIL